MGIIPLTLVRGTVADLAEVQGEVSLADLVVCPVRLPLHDGPDRLDTLSVDLPAHVLPRVVDRLSVNSAASYSYQFNSSATRFRHRYQCKRSRQHELSCC